MNRTDVYHSNRVRFELMKRLGYFVTESSEHNAEYSPWFIPHGRERVHEFAVPIDEYLRRCDHIVDEFDRLKQASKTNEPATEVRRSCEYGSTIIHSLATGKPALVYGNQPNHGAISNLPNDAIVEVATLVDRAGLRPTTVGALPPQLVGYVQPHVTQHELFIRAALEGRRDHVYQAAMFDPLTAAALPPDRIVEMCDELIAAHGTEKDGGSLPDLDAKPSRVPTSGKTFRRVNPKELRAAWEARQRHFCESVITDWQVVGPFPCEAGKRNGLDLRTPVEEELALRGDGSIDRKATYRVGDRSFRWTGARAGRRGFVDLGAALAQHEWAVAYAYAEVESAHAREATIRCGSDDGIKLWLNGAPVHANEVGRAYCPGSDAVPVRLKAGVNRILVKVDNYTAGWGFGAAVLDE
jgi:hypothetical protein